MIAVDTNVISGILNGTITNLPEEPLFVPFVVQAELYYGVAVGSNPQKYKPLIDSLLHQEEVILSIVLEPDTRDEYVKIATQLKNNGTPISPNDLWIAAECTALGYPLWTLDKDFQHVSKLRLHS